MNPSRSKRMIGQVGLVVATAMVTVTLAGGGVASAFNVPGNSVTSAKIVNNSIRSIDIKDGTLASVDVHDGALTGADVADGSLGGGDIADGSVSTADLSPQALTRWAKVDGGTTTSLIRGRGATTASRLAAGQYLVTFSQSITACGWTATVNDNDAGVAPNLYASVERNSAADANTLRVRVFNDAGTTVDTAQDDGFTVTVTC